MPNVFYKASEDALENITSVFKFLHPLNASLRFTKEKLSTELQYNPNLTQDDLQTIIDPNQYVHGVDYINLANESWNHLEEQLAWLLLNNLFAMHEGWIQRLYEEIFNQFYARTFIKNLEFPGLTDQLSCLFINDVLDKKDLSKKLPQPIRESIILAFKSTTLEDAYYQVYKSASSLDFTKLENYMLCYRCFKEARNCFMHHNFVASDELIKAYNNYQSVATTADLDVKEVPIIIAPVQGAPVQLGLRQVIGFSQIIQRIIAITDISLIASKGSEIEFLSRKPASWRKHSLSSKQSTAKGQITKYSSKAGFLKPNSTPEFQAFLINNRIFTR